MSAERLDTASMEDFRNMAATLARVEALVDKWTAIGFHTVPIRDLRAAIQAHPHNVQVFADSDYADGTVFWGWECTTCGPHDARFTSADAAQEVGDDHEATA